MQRDLISTSSKFEHLSVCSQLKHSDMVPFQPELNEASFQREPSDQSSWSCGVPCLPEDGEDRPAPARVVVGLMVASDPGGSGSGGGRPTELLSNGRRSFRSCNTISVRVVAASSETPKHYTF
ncbi:hypothetical protein PGTUg99_017007 [Puccinia graminis f. sp. tritici]|uniref:Uncharacterized protein n=1 Tax=Puccinia graminis f. sp. tritici TaxID=56615 RepID=A0A5B0MA65_PUCGR|nr:hypothetical protein PGTUg99_017007 [Puccinia graminis f. sp. tritici]